MLNNHLPPHRIETCFSEKREPGMILFNVRPGGAADSQGNLGWITGIDQNGDFPIKIELSELPQDVRSLPNGNLLYSLTNEGLIREITQQGEILRQWHIAGKWRDRTPPEGSVGIELEFTHHTIGMFPNGNLMVLSAEIREFDNWPENDTDENAPRSTRRVVGDLLLEIGRDGEIIHCHKLLDILDPYRLCYGSCSKYWEARGLPDTNDWCHTNAVFYHEPDDTLIASLRTQDCIIKIDRKSGELKWILGDHGNWKEPWADKLLQPIGDVEWQYHQHDCSVTPTGTILCFDNGNFRALPFNKRLSSAENYSRIVEFEVDEKTMTVKQVWAYGKDPGERLYACYQGGAMRLPKTGNTVMTYGGICTRDGKPHGAPSESFARARLIEVTPAKEIVFDMWIDGSEETVPMSLSSFRAEFIGLL